MKNTDQYPLVSIITVNYNTAAVTAELLKSLGHITYPNVEVIVVDNASTEDASYLADDFPHIKLIKNTVNEGFAGGNNRGIEAAGGEILFLLNNDTEVIPGFIEPVADLFSFHHKIGIVSPKIRYFHSPNIIQYAGGEAINSFTARGKFIGSGEEDRGQHDTPQQTHLAHGAAMAIHRRVIDEVGLLPEMFFLYYEELDYTEHVQRAGFTVWYEPRSLVLHKESMSVGKLSNLKIYYQNRNRLLFIRRNVFGFKGFISKVFFLTISVPAGLIRQLLLGNRKAAAGICSGVAWNLKYKLN
ncbi:glycosyltransferase family 2 protein [Mucilaginibacter pedocola]|uniref:Glycosyltransferase 2-like domain-containing protein n=1 Tax=Mucilaginibacter pedocola TaxID=1792845 RepID=A0A1S9P795_9SPHI|nr:glycosyltransferase family 2 protein [Mucilaginibacter pedocola]OOQ56707.1 hypothetical protein BC343_17065 [Mucilaginibacter pedocola]